MPRLIHPIKVQIKKAEKSVTFYDDDLHEPIGQVKREEKPVSVWAQIKDLDEDDPQPASGGILETSRGYILMRIVDLKRAHLTIERGDQIVQIGEGANARIVNFYITKFQHRGHYPQAKGNTLLKAWFVDRHPSRQQGDL